MNALPVLLLLLIEDRVLVLGQHLLLARHLGIPPLNRLGGLSVALECGADGIDDAIDVAQALALAGFLGRGEAPWGLPVREVGPLVRRVVWERMDGVA